MKQLASFDPLDHLRGISEVGGDPLEEVARVIDFEVSRPVLDEALACSDGSKGGRPKDADARCGVPEPAIPVFGNRSHFAIDRELGLIRTFAVTDAARHGDTFPRQVATINGTAAPKLAVRVRIGRQRKR